MHEILGGRATFLKLTASECMSCHGDTQITCFPWDPRTKHADHWEVVLMYIRAPACTDVNKTGKKLLAWAEDSTTIHCSEIACQEEAGHVWGLLSDSLYFLLQVDGGGSRLTAYTYIYMYAVYPNDSPCIYMVVELWLLHFAWTDRHYAPLCIVPAPPPFQHS